MTGEPAQPIRIGNRWRDIGASNPQPPHILWAQKVPENLDFRGWGPHEARRHFLEERHDLATLQLTAEDHLAIGVNAVHLKTRLGDVETDCLNCLHVWLLSIVGALTAPTFMALARRWRSRPQHQ